jgi:hypothetical protein
VVGAQQRGRHGEGVEEIGQGRGGKACAGFQHALRGLFDGVAVFVTA